MRQSNKAYRAGNQQERFVKLSNWIVGFVDGEGCFSLGFIKQQDRKVGKKIRKGYKVGYQVFHEFAITQGESSLSVLRKIHKFFKVGKIYINKRYDNHTEDLYRFVVRGREELINVIIPFFENNKLRTVKRGNFEKFAECIKLMSKGKHLKKKGLIKIAKIAENMNRKKSGKNLAKILRDYTPDS